MYFQIPNQKCGFALVDNVAWCCTVLLLEIAWVNDLLLVSLFVTTNVTLRGKHVILPESTALNIYTLLNKSTLVYWEQHNIGL